MSKTGFFLVGGLILATIAYQIFGRIPSDVLNVALGVMCGIGASIPVSLGLLIALTRRRNQDEQPIEWAEPEPARYVPQSVPQVAATQVQRIPQQSGYAPQLAQSQMQYAPQVAPHPSPLQQPQIIVVTPQGQFAQGQFPQGFQMPAQWNPQQYPFMQEHANAVDAREWRIIGEE